MAVSWTPLCIPNEPTKVEALVKDVIWILESMVVDLTREGASGNTGSKRKSDAGSEALSKKLKLTK
jgi:hypothetical protein